jgi:hypothetical protein
MTLLKNPNIEAKLYRADEIDISSTLYNSPLILSSLLDTTFGFFITHSYIILTFHACVSNLEDLNETPQNLAKHE